MSDKNLFEGYVELPTGKFRKAFYEEASTRLPLKLRIIDLRAKRDHIETELKEALQECDHLIFEDTRGYPYDLRNCGICGKGLGIV